MKLHKIYPLLLALIFSACFSKEKITEIDYSIIEEKQIFSELPGNTVIDEEEDLRRLTTNEKLTIDLTKKTVLSMKGSASGCEAPQIDIKVIRDDSNKKYFVTAIIYQEGFCKMLIPYQKVFAIDKIKKNYEVVFETRTIIKDNFLFEEDSN